MMALDPGTVIAVMAVLGTVGGIVTWLMKMQRRLDSFMTNDAHVKICEGRDERLQAQLAERDMRLERQLADMQARLDERERTTATHRLTMQRELVELGKDIVVVQTVLNVVRKRRGGFPETDTVEP